MNEREFKDFVKSRLRGLPLEQQEKTLQKMKLLWIEELFTEFNVKTTKGYTKCNKCGKYSKSDAFTYLVEPKKVLGETICFGVSEFDSDEIADVTYGIRYSICPKCNNKKEIERWCIREENRREKYNRN